MADLNYINPQSLNPGQNYKPSGFLAGMYYDQQQKDYQNMLGLQQAMTGMDAQRKQGDLADYMAARPSALAATLASNQATANTVGRLKEAQATDAENNAKFNKETLISRINDQLGSNDEKTRQRALNGVNMTLQVMDLLSPALATGNKEAVSRIMQAHNIKPDNPLFQDIINSPNPSQRLKDYQQSFSEAQGRGKQFVEDLKGHYGTEEARIMAEARKYAADQARLAAQYKTQHQKYTEKLEGFLVKGMEKLPTITDPKERADLITQMTDAKRTLYMLNALRAPFGASELGASIINDTRPNPAGAAKSRVDAAMGEHSVGEKLNYNGTEVEITEVLPDGSYRVRGPNGRMGTLSK